MSQTNKAGGGTERLWPLFVGLPLIVAVALAAVLLSGERPQPAAQEQRAQPAGSGAGREVESQSEAVLGHPSLGSEDAPVVMIEYGDFR